MKHFYLFAFAAIIAASLSIGSTCAQPRGAIWVHGLNDNANEFANWENIFTSQRQELFTRSRGTFNSRAGVVNMANQVIASYVPDNRNIYFGHSLGGVVGRDIDVRGGSSFGGIITSGSPLDGARIANTTRNGEASNMMADGIHRVIQGPIRQFTGPVFWIGSFIVEDIVRFLESTLDIFNVRDLNDQGAEDLQEGSAYMNSGVRNIQTPTIKVLIYGNENGPTCWRLASQAIGNGDDEHYVQVARNAGDVYEAAMWINYGYAVVGTLFSFGIAGTFPAWVAEGWGQGMNWWRYDSESGWNYLIGANIPATRTVMTQNFNYVGFNECMTTVGPNWTPQDYNRCQQWNTTTEPYTYYSPVNGQSDAFIKAPSQTGYNSAWANQSIKIEAEGVNYLEMDRHPRMQVIYNEIFNGNHGSFFTTN